MISPEAQVTFMREALKEAQRAYEHGEVPIGAVVVKSGTIIGRGYNARELNQQAIQHAEMMAISQANQAVGNWRLNDCSLFVTIEPCLMCAGAIGLARLPEIYFGATNPKFGAVSSLYQILEDDRLNHRVQVTSGVLADEAAQLMQKFFRTRRAAQKMVD